MMRAICLGSMCLVLAACGGGGSGDSRDEAADTSGPTVPAAEYAQRADDLCRQLLVDLEEAQIQQRLRTIQAGPASDSAKFKRFAPIFAEQLELVSEFRRRIEQLGMPSAHGDDARALLEKTRSAEDELQNAIDAARSGDAKGATDAIQRYAGFSAQSASIARDSKLNFAICGAGA